MLKTRSIIRGLAAVTVLLPALCHAQTYLPQIADGGNWYTAVVLVNTTASAATASLSFFQDGASGATTPWNPPFIEETSTQNLSIPAGGTLYMHTPGTAGTLTQGWGQVTAPAGVTAYAIYTYESFEGRPNQDGTSLAVAGTTRILVPFDATTGYSTGIAIVNPTAAQENVSVNIQTDDGNVTQTLLPALPASGQLAFSIATQFPVTVGHRGVAEFYVSSGAISIAAFRINPTIALTSLPVVLASGPPVLGGGGGSITLPQFKVLLATVNLSSTDSGGNPITAGLADTVQIVALPSQSGYAGASFSGSLFLSPTDVVFFNSQLTGVAVNGNTFTLGGNIALNSYEISLVAGTKAMVTFSSVTLTLTPGESVSQGTVTGTFTIVSGGATSMGTLTGTYTAQ